MVIKIARTSKPITCRVFIGDRPIEMLTADEREKFAESCVNRMGEALNGYFNHHVSEYQAVCKI